MFVSYLIIGIIVCIIFDIMLIISFITGTCENDDVLKAASAVELFEAILKFNTISIVLWPYRIFDFIRYHGHRK